MRALVAMGADIDDEGAAGPRQVKLVGAEQEQDIGAAEHAGDILAALARHETDVEPADARRRIVQHGKSVPVFRDRADRNGEFCRETKHRRAVRPRQRALPDDDQRMLGLLQHLEEVAVAVGEILQRLRSGAQRYIGIAQVYLLADQRRPADRPSGSACGCGR